MNREMKYIQVESLIFSICGNYILIPLFFYLMCSNEISAQNVNFKIDPTINDETPEWAIKMYSGEADISEIVNLYQEYHKTNKYIKTIHTQNYKHWISTVGYQFGQINQLKENDFNNDTDKTFNDDWKVIGPLKTVGYSHENQEPGISQANVYCFDRCISSPNIIVAGSEHGGAFLSLDTAKNWNYISSNLPIQIIDDIVIDDYNPNIIYIAGRSNTFYNRSMIFKTEDQGLTWIEVLSISRRIIETIQILDDGKLVAGGESGLYIINEDGTSSHVYTERVIDVQINPLDHDDIYFLSENSSEKILEFYKSFDRGKSFQLKDQGWYTSDGSLNDNKVWGGGIGVSNSDPNVIYVIAAAALKNEDNGYLGVMKSNDGGETWTIPTGNLGAPYSDDHLNLLSSNRDGTGYHQGQFNIAIAVDPKNSDNLLIGGITLNRSIDGGHSFKRITGWDNQNNFPSNGFHADVQDAEIFEDYAIISNDGGISFSSNIFDTPQVMENRNIGINAAAFRGLGQGWNSDIIVGGTNHNGDRYTNLDLYPEGIFWQIGGGEAPSGSVNPGDNSILMEKSTSNAFTSSPSGIIQHRRVNGVFEGLEVISTLPIPPNVSLYPSWSTEIEFEPNCFSNFYVGSGNKIIHVIDHGKSIEELAEFSEGKENVVAQIKVFRDNPHIMFTVVRDVQADPLDKIVSLYRSEDKGKNWEEIFSQDRLGWWPGLSFDIDQTEADKIIVCDW